MFNQPSIVTAVVSLMSPQSKVKFSGIVVKTGGAISGVTVNVADVVAVLPQASVAVQVTSIEVPVPSHTSNPVVV